MTGGFPNIATFQTEVLGEIAARVIASDPGVGTTVEISFPGSRVA